MGRVEKNKASIKIAPMLGGHWAVICSGKIVAKTPKPKWARKIAEEYQEKSAQPQPPEPYAPQ